MSEPAEQLAVDTARGPAVASRRLLLVVIDGLGAEPLRRAIDSGHAPTLAAILEAGGRFDEAISPFPSLTPVCLSTIVTGAGPDRHRVPSLSWYHRGQGRFVEYGSSFAASRVEGWGSTIEDVLLNLNHVHLAEEPRTLFEVVEDAGFEAASINYLVWRGRTRHTFKHGYGPLGRVAKRAKLSAVYGPQHFIFSELFGSSDTPRMPQIGIKRPRDWTGAHATRWLLRNTDARFLLLYLGEHDVASHKLGPDETRRAIRVADRALGRVISGMGGVERFREQCALVLCADHGQTAVGEGAYSRIDRVFEDDVEVFRGSRTHAAASCDIAITPSNRVAMAYRLRDEAPTSRWIATRALEADGVDLTAFAEEGRLVVLHSKGGELRAVRGGSDALPTHRAAVTGDDHDVWELDGDLAALDLRVEDGKLCYGAYPDALHRLDEAIRCVNAGDVLISGSPGWEFVDIGGGAHPGGSHGSLHVADSTAPLLTFGLDPAPPELPLLRLSDIAPMVAGHLQL